MPRPPTEFQAFTSLLDRLLEIPKDELNRRMVAYKEKADKNPYKRGPKKKKPKGSSSPPASTA